MTPRRNSCWDCFPREAASKPPLIAHSEEHGFWTVLSNSKAAIWCEPWLWVDFPCWNGDQDLVASCSEQIILELGVCWSLMLLINRCNCHSQFKREGVRARQELQRGWSASLTCRDVILWGTELWGSSFPHSAEPQTIFAPNCCALPELEQSQDSKRQSCACSSTNLPEAALLSAATHPQSAWNEGNALWLACIKLMRTGGLGGTWHYHFLESSFVTGIHRERENTELPFKKSLCLQQVTAVAVLMWSQGSYRCDITQNWGLAIDFTANIP